MIGIFKGSDGSMGFRRGREYMFITYCKDNWIWIKTIEGLYCPYTTLEALLDNWELKI